MSGNSSWYVTTLPSLVAIGIAAVEMFLVCRVTNQDHMIKGIGDYDAMTPSRYVTALPN